MATASRAQLRPRARVLAIDLGRMASKAVVLKRRGDKLETVNHAVFDSPFAAGDVSTETLSAHFLKITEQLKYRGKEIVVAVAMDEAVLHCMAMPQAPLAEVRQMLRLSGRKCFHSDVSEHTFDVAELPAAETISGPQPPRLRPQTDVLIGGAKRELVQLVRGAAKAARLRVVEVTLTQFGSVSALHIALPDLGQRPPMVLIDFGFNYASVSLIRNGNPAMTRVIPIDGERLNRGLAESFHVAASVPAELKTDIIRSRMREHLASLAEEFRAAIEFFQAEHDCNISHGIIIGDLAVSELLVETLQLLEIPCETLRPVTSCILEFPNEVAHGATRKLSQFVPAVGAGVGWMMNQAPRLNLLAEHCEEENKRRHDPVRRVTMLAAILIAGLGLWTAQIRFSIARVDSEIRALRPEYSKYAEGIKYASIAARRSMEATRVLGALQQHATNRLLCAPVLNALQKTTTEDIQLLRLTLHETIVTVEATRPVTNNAVVVPRKAGTSTQSGLLTLVAKNFAEATAQERFIEKIPATEFFRDALRTDAPVSLKSQLPRQADPLSPSRAFTLFTIECPFKERVVGYD